MSTSAPAPTARLTQPRKQEKSAQRAAAAECAAKLWSRARPETGTHSYLRAKGIQAHGIKTGGERLLVPMLDTDDKLWNVQQINQDGEKLYLKGGRAKGLYFFIGSPADVVVVCEGFATGASIHEATGQAVAVAFSAGNLKPVAEALRKKLPGVRLTIAGDHDSHGAGQKASQDAARAVGGLVAIPPAAGLDWNDVAQADGLDAVRTGIEAAQPPARTAHDPASPPHAAAAEPEPPKIQIWDWSSFIPPAPKIDWLIEGLLPLGGAVDVYGPPGSRKSTLIYHLAATIAAGGGQWFRWPVAGGRVAIIGGEASNKNMHWRMARRIMTLSGCEPDPDRIVTLPDRPILRWAKGYVYDGRQEGWDITPVGQRVIEYLGEYRPTLLIIDTILAGAQGCNVIDVAQQYALAEELAKIANQLNCSVLTVSHTNQASMGRNIRLDDRLFYTARSGGNGAPGAWRWMAGVATIHDDDQKYLGECVARLDLASGRYFATGVSKHNEIEQPGSMHWSSPAIFAAGAGELMLVADGIETQASIREAALRAKDRGSESRVVRGGSGRRRGNDARSGGWSDERPF
ncbi:MAG TPA: AAA family ATPase [Gammaproteobacteria bacterium]|nr:AAA family ATPase [Gammaproteobacteria bacterium]